MLTINTLGNFEQPIRRLAVEEAAKQRHLMALFYPHSDPNRSNSDDPDQTQVGSSKKNQRFRSLAQFLSTKPSNSDQTQFKFSRINPNSKALTPNSEFRVTGQDDQISRNPEKFGTTQLQRNNYTQLKKAEMID